MYHSILAVDHQYGLGYKGGLPWPKNQQDLDFFKEKTLQQIVIMGRKTWDSLPSSYRPLPQRINFILSRTTREDQNTETTRWFTSVQEVLRYLDKNQKTLYPNKTAYVIGGGELYQDFLSKQIIDTLWLTRFTATYDCDTFFASAHLDRFKMKKQVWSNDTLTIQEWQYVNKEEEQYLVHLRNIINTGDFRENRTAVGSYSLFCPPQLRFDLRNHRMPLLTTKKSVLRQIFVELQFYLSGSADSKKLEEQKVFVWKGNTTREFLDGRGLHHYREGDMGPSYSFNFRHFGATYVNCDTDYTGQGFDQVQYCIDQIKNHPTSRRIIIDLWDGSKLDQMSLPPCMHKYQFYVNQGYLSCHAELRSSDTFLGLPWNIGTASLLVYMLAHTCNLLPGDLIITINDAHVYENQIQVAQEQILRQPYTAPLLYIKEGTPRDLFAFKSSDFELLNYQCQEKLSVPMVV